MLQSSDIALAPVSRTDLPQLFAWINDRDLVVLSASYRPVNELQHEAWLERILLRDDVYLFGIRQLASGRLIGSCQLLAFDRTHRTAELQIRIGDEQARGHGYGRQAVGLLLRFGFDDLNLHRIGLHVLADNAAAIRTYEKAGFVREGVLREAAYVDGRHRDVVVMGILNPNGR